MLDPSKINPIDYVYSSINPSDKKIKNLEVDGFVEYDSSDITTENSINSVELAQKTTDLAYKLKDLKTYNEKAQNIVGASLVEAGWKILCNSSENNSQYGYKAVAIVNGKSKAVHIATAGTVPTDRHDLADDFLIAQGRVPYKLEQAKAMVSKVIDLLGGQNQAVNYIFSTSGHSLGAIISDLTALEIISRDLQFDKSTTFDSPGSKAILQKSIDDNLFTGEVKSSISELAKYAEIYNAKPNFINTIGSQLGNVKLVLPNKTQAVETKIAEISESSALWEFGTYLCSKIGSTIISCSEYLGIKSVVDQIQDHSLKNFADISKTAVVFLTENWQTVDPEQLAIENSEMLVYTTQTGKDVWMPNITETDSIVNIDFKEFSYEDLRRAHKCNNSTEELRSEEVSNIGDIFGNWEIVY